MIRCFLLLLFASSSPYPNRTGIAIGLSSTPASVYAAEVAHPNLRGRLTLLTAFCTAIGMLSIYTLGYVFKVGGVRRQSSLSACSELIENRTGHNSNAIVD